MSADPSGVNFPVVTEASSLNRSNVLEGIMQTRKEIFPCFSIVPLMSLGLFSSCISR